MLADIRGGSGGGTGLRGERQESGLAEWRSQASELAESAAGCRTEPAQAVHISITAIILGT